MKKSLKVLTVRVPKSGLRGFLPFSLPSKKIKSGYSASPFGK